MLLSAVLMLEYLGEDRAAKLIESSLAAIIAGGVKRLLMIWVERLALQRWLTR